MSVASGYSQPSGVDNGCLNEVLGVPVPSVNLANGVVIDANVCYSEGPGKLFVHPWCYRKFVLQMTKLVEFLYSDSPNEFLPVRPQDYDKGCCCVAKFEGDYYRAKILKRVSPGSFEVQFPDFGNISTVRLCDMRQLHDRLSLAHVPPIALQIVDYWGGEICQNESISDEMYDDSMDSRVVSIKLQNQCGAENAWSGKVHAWGEDDVHPLNKPKEQDMSLSDFDKRSGLYTTVG